MLLVSHTLVGSSCLGNDEDCELLDLKDSFTIQLITVGVPCPSKKSHALKIRKDSKAANYAFIANYGKHFESCIDKIKVAMFKALTVAVCSRSDPLSRLHV